MAASAAAANGPSAAAADVVDRLIHEASLVLQHQGQLSLAELVLTITVTLVPRESGDDDAMSSVLINDDVRDVVVGDPALLDEFRDSIRGDVRRLQQVGYDEHVISNVFAHLVLGAARRAAGFIPSDDGGDEPYRNGGGFGAVPASAAAVRSLEKQTFRAAARGNDEDAVTDQCGICFEEFVDGAQVGVMPCPCRGHRFHMDCIAKWLGVSNMCPLCRHQLPTTDDTAINCPPLMI